MNERSKLMKALKVAREAGVAKETVLDLIEMEYDGRFTIWKWRSGYVRPDTEHEDKE